MRRKGTWSARDPPGEGSRRAKLLFQKGRDQK